MFSRKNVITIRLSFLYLKRIFKLVDNQLVIVMNGIRILFYILTIFSLSCVDKGYTDKEGEQDCKIKLSVYPLHTGTVTGSATLKKGDTATITASPTTGFIFDCWQIAGSNEIFSKEKIHTFQVNHDLALIAVFRNVDENSLINVSEQIEIATIANYGLNVPKDKLLMVTRYIGDDFVKNGISLDRSGIVNDKGFISMVLNTKELESKGRYVPITGGGPHIWVYKHFSPGIFPWSKNGEYLSLSVKAAVPYVELTDSQGNISTHNFTSEQAPVTQLSFGLYFTDLTTGVIFAITVPMYESRGSFRETANQHDTSTSFAISPLESNTIYVTKAPLSASLQSQPFVDLRYFEVHITRQNLERIVRDTKENLSADISRYELTMAGILFELPNYVKNGHNISMANLSDLRVKIDTEK